MDETTIPLLGQVSPGTEVLVQLFWDRLVLMNQRHETLLTVPRPYTGRTAEIPWTQVFANWLSKPRSVTHSQFLRMLPDALQAFVTTPDLPLRKERLQAIYHWSAVYSLEQIADALLVPGLALEVSRVTAFLGMKHGGRDVPITWVETLSPPGTRTENLLERYDRLRGVM